MARIGGETAPKQRMQYRGLRGWLEQVDKMGELRKVDGAHWDVEMGAHHPHADREEPRRRAGDPVRRRARLPARASARCTAISRRSRRVALTLGLPLDHERKVDIVQRYHARMQELKPLPPRFVKDGPILENVLEGDDIDVLKFPVPRHHELRQGALHRHRRLRDDAGPRRRLVQPRRLSQPGL